MGFDACSRAERIQFKPVSHIFLKPYAVHKVVNGFFQSLAEAVVVDTAGVGKADVVAGKPIKRALVKRNAIGLRVLAYRRMYGTGKSVKKTALNTAVFKQLAHVFQGVHGILYGLGGKAVHQIGVDQNARL